jgi:3-oxoacyl-(acyl-carrier-protein) synthase
MTFDTRLEREATQAVGDAIAVLFEGGAAGDRLGLIVVSDNAGTATSVQFWADAQRTGVALASPELFPWCLANAPCGALARRFGVTGPNLTLLGEGEALWAAFDQAEDLLAAGQVEAVVLVSISYAADDARGQAVAWRAPRHHATSAPRAARRGAASLREAMAALASRSASSCTQSEAPLPRSQSQGSITNGINTLNGMSA